MSAGRFFTVAVTTYGVGFLAWLLWPAFRDSLIGGIVGIPPFSVYVFEHLGVPGLTDPKDCDWMWCKPTAWGAIFTTVVWLGAAWLVSVGVARLSRSVSVRTRGRSASPPAR
jgi:hypothetical protein